MRISLDGAYTPAHETVLENPGLDFRVWFMETRNPFTPPHFHDALELEFLPSGSSQLYIRNQLHQLTAGQWGVINPNVVHTTACLHTNTCLLLMFPSSLLQRMVSDYDRRELLMPQELPVHPALAQLNLAATALIEALECSCPEQNLTVTRRALDILSLFYAYFSRPSDSAYQFRGDERLFDLLEYAAGHYAESIPISDAARLCHLQPSLRDGITPSPA